MTNVGSQKLMDDDTTQYILFTTNSQVSSLSLVLMLYQPNWIGKWDMSVEAAHTLRVITVEIYRKSGDLANKKKLNNWADWKYIPTNT